MNKEKQIEYLKEELNVIQCIKRSLFNDEIDELSIDIKKLNFMEKLFDIAIKILQIEPRTIETLKVGDCLDITINDENVTCYLKIDNIETAKEYLNSLKSYEIHQIIPREFLELWGDINA